MIKTITLETLEHAAESEVFNFIAHHLLKQNQAARVGKACKYRLGTLSCAAGCLIGPGEYSSGMEGDLWRHLVEKCDVPSDHAGLIQEMQSIHDDNPVGDWPDCIQALAQRRKVKLEPEVHALIKLRTIN